MPQDIDIQKKQSKSKAVSSGRVFGEKCRCGSSRAMGSKKRDEIRSGYARQWEIYTSHWPAVRDLGVEVKPDRDENAVLLFTSQAF